MIINGKDVDRYFSSHSAQEVHTVLNALQMFALHRELELYLRNGLYKKKFEFRDQMAKMSIRRDQKSQAGIERDLKRVTSHNCPECDQPLQGTDKVGCAGRSWYEECTECTYYREEFGGK